jgi:HNH endonuclease
MSWAYLDDQIAFHRKTLAAGNEAFGAWIRMIAHACAYDTRGVIERPVALSITTKKQIGRLVDVVLLEVLAGGPHYRITGPELTRIVYQRHTITPRIRRAVLDRDGLRCRLCGTPIDRADVHIDHVVPVSMGGRSTLDNLRATHSKCNLRRGNRVSP